MKRTALILVLVFVLGSCASVYKKKGLTIVLDLNRENLNRSSVLILNFNPPAYAADSGKRISEFFHMELLRTKKFKITSLYNSSDWYRLSEEEETQLLKAIEEAEQKNFDYVLVGKVKDYFYGGTTRSRVTVKLRLMEVKTRTTIFLAEYGEEAKSKDPHYPMSPKLARLAKHPDMLTRKIVKELVKRI